MAANKNKLIGSIVDVLSNHRPYQKDSGLMRELSKGLESLTYKNVQRLQVVIQCLNYTK